MAIIFCITVKGLYYVQMREREKRQKEVKREGIKLYYSCSNILSLPIYQKTLKKFELNKLLTCCRLLFDLTGAVRGPRTKTSTQHQQTGSVQIQLQQNVYAVK